MSAHPPAPRIADTRTAATAPGPLMLELRHAKDIARLRKLALQAQGLLEARPFGSGLDGAGHAIEHMGHVQIDTISVVERAHHHVLYNRVPGYQPAMLEQLLSTRRIFEYWAHAAAFLPIQDFRYSLPYKHAIRSGQTHWFRNHDRQLMRELLARIRSDGPLRSRDLEDGRDTRAGWWDWKPAKKALEQLYMEGELMVRSREGFQKTYDLTERVLPAHVDTRMPDTRELAHHVIEQQLRCQGLVRVKSLAYHQPRNPALRKALQAQVEDQIANHELDVIRLPDGERWVTAVGALDQPSPRVRSRLQILSPFDNSVIQRDRLRSLFGFDYQIECYVPAAKRQFGYFSLPLLYRDGFVGRMDCKAHRRTRRLEIVALHFEPSLNTQGRLIAALANALQRFCAFQQCVEIGVGSSYPRAAGKALRQALTAAR